MHRSRSQSPRIEISPSSSTSSSSRSKVSDSNTRKSKKQRSASPTVHVADKKPRLQKEEKMPHSLKEEKEENMPSSPPAPVKPTHLQQLSELPYELLPAHQQYIMKQVILCAVHY